LGLCAAKFGLEGWMLSLQQEVKPFGIDVTIVNPRFSRTELLTDNSTQYAGKKIDDYTERRIQQMQFWKGANSQQSGDPAKLANALIKVASEQQPTLRFIAGADAISASDQVALTLQKQIDAHRELSNSLAYDNA
jgi:NAD(P)-dependent dehydrogenase (short-subunit alcohol dehydrogenase family)